MRKLRIFVLLLILAFSFNVKAEVSFEIDCNGKEITSDKNVVCEGNLIYENEGITDIEFDYDTNLNIKFIPVDGFKLTDSKGKITIHSDNVLKDKITNSTKIMKFTLGSNSNLKELESITFSNIRINKTNDILVDDIKEEFNVSLNKEVKLDSTCTLDSITIENNKLSNFDKTKLIYKDIKVTKEVIFIDAVRTSDKSSATGLGQVRVPNGETIERKITVTAEDGSNKVYKLYITNTNPKEEVKLPEEKEDDISKKDEEITKEVKSEDNTLKTLEVYYNNKKINFDFSSNQLDYNIDIDVTDTKKITVKAELNDEKATFVSSYGPRDVTFDKDNFDILVKVKAENNDEKTYKITVVTSSKEIDDSLKLLKINNINVDLTADKLEVKLPYTEEKTKIEVETNNDKAKVEYEDVDLKVGNNNIKITVTLDNQVKEYNVVVIRESESELFEKLEITGYDLNFSKDKKSYNLKVDKEVSELEIKVVPNNIDFEVLNNKNIRDGSKVQIKVTDKEGEYEYIIHIEKDNLTTNIICYGIFGIGIISLIVAFSCVIRKKKCKKVLNNEEI